MGQGAADDVGEHLLHDRVVAVLPLGLDQLGRRERQIMEIIYRRGRANAAEVLADLPDPPTYTAVRGMLRLLESKGHLRHEQDGPRYVYIPTANPDRVSKSAVRHLVRTFFDNSAGSAVAAMVGIMFMASTLLTPLYVIYEQAFHFSRITLTLVYAVYVVGNLAANMKSLIRAKLVNRSASAAT